MCTSVIYKNRYFGRNLDYEFSYGEILNKHFAIIGMPIYPIITLYIMMLSNKRLETF